MSKKVPITRLYEGNCCPKCGSSKVVLYMQFPLIAKFDMNGRVIITDYKGKRIYKPSNRKKAALYEQALGSEFQCANYECTKCGWISEMYAP